MDMWFLGRQLGFEIYNGTVVKWGVRLFFHWTRWSMPPLQNQNYAGCYLCMRGARGHLFDERTFVWIQKNISH